MLSGMEIYEHLLEVENPETEILHEVVRMILHEPHMWSALEEMDLDYSEKDKGMQWLFQHETQRFHHHHTRSNHCVVNGW